MMPQGKIGGISVSPAILEQRILNLELELKQERRDHDETRRRLRAAEDAAATARGTLKAYANPLNWSCNCDPDVTCDGCSSDVFEHDLYPADGFVPARRALKAIAESDQK